MITLADFEQALYEIALLAIPRDHKERMRAVKAALVALDRDPMLVTACGIGQPLAHTSEAVAVQMAYDRAWARWNSSKEDRY
jgi:hypothetical protein